MRLALLALLVLSCGIKGPPRPPLDEPAPPAPTPTVDRPDAGCCGSRP